MKIKNKFSLSFAPILILALVIYTMIALELFRKDKIAYIFSANQDGSHLASMLSENIYLAQAPLLEVIISSFSFPDGKFTPTAKSHLQLTDSIKFIIIYGVNNNQLEILDAVGTKSEGDKAFIKELSQFQDKSALALFQEELLIQKEITVKRFKFEKYLLRLVLQSNAIKTLLEQPRIYHLALAKKEGQILLNSKAQEDPQAQALMATFIKENVIEKDFPFSKERDSFIMTWSPIRGTDLGFVTATEKEKAMSAIEQMKRKSLGIMLLLVSICLFIIIRVVSGLTKNIESLSASLTSFSEGNLNEKSQIHSTDEVGLLSKNFNQMTNKIKELIIQSESKARMESELNTARRVQSLFLPQEDLETSQLSIRGYIESASECGGDWWSFQELDKGCRFFIADVTGHGVAPAILTAALNAACETLREFQHLNLSDFVSYLNSVIYKCSKGELLLSLFVGEVSITDNTLTYVNASHCSPMLLHTNKELDILDVVSGPHLGRSAKESYTMTSVPFLPGEKILVYTDGLTEFTNSQGRAYGEKKLYKLIQKNSNYLLQEYMDLRTIIQTDFEDYREGLELTDDVTFIAINRKINTNNLNSTV